MMRPDQLTRLQELSERLADAFILEADPTEWPGDGQSPADLTQEDRGNRYWCKKNAMATGAVLRYVLDVTAKHTDPDNKGAVKDEDDLDAQIKAAEKKAKAAVNKALARAKAPHGG
jgi:hypothetical protein